MPSEWFVISELTNEANNSEGWMVSIFTTITKVLLDKDNQSKIAHWAIHANLQVSFALSGAQTAFPIHPEDLRISFFRNRTIYRIVQRKVSFAVHGFGH